MLLTQNRILYSIPALLSLTLLVLGCQPSSNSSGTPSGGGKSTTVAPAGSNGMQLYSSSGCGNCHALNGQGGGKAPDLSRVGATRDANWIADHIKDPKTHNPSSRMPASKGKIADTDIMAIATFLAGKK